MSKEVKIIPLGGLDKIGMNITAIEYGETIVVVDCGISFPDDDMLGIDKVIPDVTYLVQNREKVKGFVITHGHEDHIGALPYILPQINVPVYATRLTMGLIEHKLEEAKLLKKTKRKVVKQGGCVNLGEMRIEFVKTNHSIAGAAALAIYTPAGMIFHTGDFKVDYTPLFGEAIDLQRMGILGKKGVLAVMCDSTNAMRPGFTPSETKVAKTFDMLFSENKGNRIIVATFASNVDRVQQIMNTAYKFGRKVILQGRSMETVIKIAEELGYVTVPENTLIEVEQMNRYPDEKLVFITTGSQGEAMAALSRMADSTHKKVVIKPNDVIIFSSTPIPGNEKAVSRVVNELARKGANVIFQDTHVSGHACQEEIKLIYSLLKPQYAIPVHGEYRHLLAGANVAQDLGIEKDHVFVLDAGDVLELSQERGRVTSKVQAGGIYVDGLGVGDVGNIVLRDRQSLSEDGIIIVTMSFEKGTNRLLAGPDIISRGFVYIRESEELIREMRKVALKAIEKCEGRKSRDWGYIKSEIRDGMDHYLWKKIKRSPMVLPVIMEV
ncbi:ribonuclease J [Lactonifactor longoviformis]|uniref:ribonuclease J n=1 Tax=Lactonifactor TaxID=420345 RepID=UPI0012B04DF6|nr:MULTISPECIES: ribonuclease J [Lactonifactor]MCB5711107.1 ribonuclease J [Lactonifactor longoviformis]MCB5715074.1 ribonuclease J [Lactonifactor longoviformis]MCQ4669915.1 ribonuclease J [Lactonifactor longoviformis]MSA00370.1 RNase J family beta-CASP ribonuclease [Lactonifactor sp. BIOML-A5]MSA07539.1 RNase J family beta-CASP ribonuclease [Lactonifactor sp. BIOML-A4]